MNLSFNMPVRVFFGENCVAEHRDMLGGFGKKAIIITDPISAKVTGAGDDVIKALEANGVEHILFDRVESNPTVDCVREAIKVCKDGKVDFIVAIGGGSSLDVGKAVALLSRQDVSDDEMFTKEYANDMMPLVAIPTTSGTGSEVTPYAMIIDTKKGTKNNLHTSFLFARVAFLDPRYTLTVPLKVTINTAIDAMTHAMESLFAKTSNSLVASMAFESIRNIGTCFDCLLCGKLDLKDREKLMLGSVMGGMVVSQTRTSALHGMSYPMTSVGHIPHGRAMALILANYMTFWREHEPELIDKMISTMGLDSLDTFNSIIAKLVGDISPEERLSEETIAAYADEVMQKHNIINTRVPVTRDDVVKMYHY